MILRALLLLLMPLLAYGNNLPDARTWTAETLPQILSFSDTTADQHFKAVQPLFTPKAWQLWTQGYDQEILPMMIAKGYTSYLSINSSEDIEVQSTVPLIITVPARVIYRNHIEQLAIQYTLQLQLEAKDTGYVITALQFSAPQHILHQQQPNCARDDY